tara:strand:+ start:6163 stop:6714 length:552 start_codon:yes stop_codon:yes gene_type:complete
MTKAFRQEGKSIEISGVAATVSSGSVYRRTGATGNFARAWVGVVTDEIIGTSAQQTTLDGRPINIGDGAQAEAQTGEGKGDMMIQGVFTMRLPLSGIAIADSDPIYMNVADVTNPGAVASGVTNNQWDDGTDYFSLPISGALVGFAVGANYVGLSEPYVGLNVVDVKLLGLPLHGLAEIAPSA